jgi:hypothetical protein
MYAERLIIKIMATAFKKFQKENVPIYENT